MVPHLVLNEMMRNQQKADRNKIGVIYKEDDTLIDTYDGRICVEISPDYINRNRIYSSEYDKDKLIKFLINNVGIYKTEKLVSCLKKMEAIIAYGIKTGHFGDGIFTEDLKVSRVWNGIMEAVTENDTTKICDVVQFFDDSLSGVEEIYEGYIRDACHVTGSIPVDFIIKMTEAEVKEFIQYDYNEYLNAKSDYEKVPDEDRLVKKIVAYDMTINTLKELLRRKRITNRYFDAVKDEIYNGTL